MIVERNKAKVTFRVIHKKPLSVKTLKEYKKSRKEFEQMQKLILEDTGEEVLFLNEDPFRK